MRISVVAVSILWMAGISSAIEYRAIILRSDAECRGVGGGQQVGYGVMPDGRHTRALLWDGTSGSEVDLTPSWADDANAYDVWDGQQVGFGRAAGGLSSHAVLWSGTASSAVDLHPGGFQESVANGIWGDQQVGSGVPKGGIQNHALLWSGTASSVVDLHPKKKYDASWADDCWGTWQVGKGIPSGGYANHALLWSGTAASVIDLHQSRWTASYAEGLWAGQQVGACTNLIMEWHAALWYGSAASFVDLTPPDCQFAYAVDCCADKQVGYGYISSRGTGDYHAFLWSGTKNSMIDLHKYLPAKFTGSWATGIDADGSIVGGARGKPGEVSQHAVIWVPLGAPMYRFWSPILSRHFYTTSGAELEKLTLDYPTAWTFEGTAYYALPDDSDPKSRPVYRFWSPVLSGHFYTISEAERDSVLEQYPDVWVFEGPAFQAYPEGRQPADAKAVYRFWSDRLSSHFYTISGAEKDRLIAAYPDVWTLEGVAWYAYE